MSEGAPASRPGAVARLGLASRRGFGQITPDPFVLAVALTVLVVVAALVFGEGEGVQGRLDVIAAWSGAPGLWKLLTFAMQATLMLVLGTALAEAPAFRRALQRLASIPRSHRQLVALTAFVSIILALLNWSLSLIGGALFAKAAGRRIQEEGWSLHYPLVCAAAYSGLMVWHGGLSGTAPLKVTAAADVREVLGAELAARIGEIPLERTLLSPLNLLVTGGLLVLGPVLFALLTPRPGTDPDPKGPPSVGPSSFDTSAPPREAGDTDAAASEQGPLLVERIERSPVVSWLLIVPMGAGLASFLWRDGLGHLDLNTVNLALWCAALVLHGRPQAFLAACERGIRGCTGIVLQFPLYAGIMGVMGVSGLSARLTELVAQAGASGLAPLTFLSAGSLNLLVPSGGGQWAVQGPIIMQAALDLGVPVERVLMAMAYGDQWTNMLQPFWALPLLGMTGVRARDIVGYTALWMVVGGLWMLAVLLV